MQSSAMQGERDIQAEERAEKEEGSEADCLKVYIKTERGSATIQQGMQSKKLTDHQKQYRG